VEVEGAPDLAAQLLDKLVENAVDFPPAARRCASRSTTPVAPQRSPSPTRGPLLPDKMRTRSVRVDDFDARSHRHRHARTSGWVCTWRA
jgi:hypothetical protein